MAITVVDGNNVMGTVPDGWWRDRPAALRRLHQRLATHQKAARPGEQMVMVLDVPQADLPAGDNDGINIRYPPRRGRDAADHEILRFLDELSGAGTATSTVTVVTSDRALASAATGRGATVIGARRFLDQLTTEEVPES